MPDAKVFELPDWSEQEAATRLTYAAVNVADDPETDPPNWQDYSMAIGGAYGLAENGADGYAFGMLRQFSGQGSGGGAADDTLDNNGETPVVRWFDHSVPLDLLIPAYDEEVDDTPSAPVYLLNKSANVVTLVLDTGVTLVRPAGMGLELVQGQAVCIIYQNENEWLLLSGSFATP